MKRHQFSTRSLFRTVTIWAVLLAIVAGFTRWQLSKNLRKEAERILFSHGGLTSHASALHVLRTRGEDHWSWIGTTFFNYVEYVDWSINSWSRKESESQGSNVVPPVDDEAIELLWTFKKLKQLNLRGVRITDAGLQSLLKLRYLEKLDISGTQVTTAGLKSFQAMNPSCQIINDPGWESERSPLCENHWERKQTVFPHTSRSAEVKRIFTVPNSDITITLIGRYN